MPAKMTVGAAFNLYVSDRERDGKNVKRMQQAWKPLSVHFETLPPESVSKADCRRYIEARRAVGVSDGGIRTELSYLSAALKHLLGGKAPPIQRTPAGRPRERHLTRAEARMLIHCAVEAHVRLWIILALATAGRPSHILQLTWTRVDLKRRIIDLDDRERDRTAKGRARVPINDMAYDALRIAREVALTAQLVEFAFASDIVLRMAVRAIELHLFAALQSDATKLVCEAELRFALAAGLDVPAHGSLLALIASIASVVCAVVCPRAGSSGGTSACASHADGQTHEAQDSRIGERVCARCARSHPSSTAMVATASRPTLLVLSSHLAIA